MILFVFVVITLTSLLLLSLRSPIDDKNTEPSSTLYSPSDGRVKVSKSDTAPLLVSYRVEGAAGPVLKSTSSKKNGTLEVSTGGKLNADCTDEGVAAPDIG